MQEIQISTALFSKMRKCKDLMNIVEHKPVTTLFEAGKKKYVVTGGGPDYLYAYEVIPIEFYVGELQPLTYSAHFVEVNLKMRKRGYSGMKIKHQQDWYVCLEPVKFTNAEQAFFQISLF